MDLIILLAVIICSVLITMFIIKMGKFKMEIDNKFSSYNGGIQESIQSMFMNLQKDITITNTKISSNNDEMSNIGKSIVSLDGQFKNIFDMQRDISENQKKLEPNIKELFSNIKELIGEKLNQISETNKKSLVDILDKMGKLETSMQEQTLKNMKNITTTLNERLEKIEQKTDSKLTEIQLMLIIN